MPPHQIEMIRALYSLRAEEAQSRRRHTEQATRNPRWARTHQKADAAAAALARLGDRWN